MKHAKYIRTGALEVFRSWGGKGRGAVGAEVERRRREESSAAGAGIEAPKAPRGVGRGCPLPTGGGVWEGAVPPPQKIF